MKASSIHSRELVAKYFESQPPQLQCDYALTIYENEQELQGTSSQIVLTGFNIPDIGIGYSNGKLGHMDGELKFSAMNLKYVITSSSSSDVIYQFVENQFINGVPKYIPFNSLPNVAIYRITSDSPVLVMMLKHCRFSYPKPDINLSSDQAAVYDLVVTFEDFTIE